MAWSKQPDLIPTEIGVIKHFLDDKDGTTPNRSMKFRLSVLDQQGQFIRERAAWSGDEAPHLTAGQISGVLSFLDERRAAFPGDLGVQAVGRVIHFLVDQDGSPGGQSISYRVIDGAGQAHTGDEGQFLTGAQLSLISTFLNSQRTKAESQILP